MAEQAAPNDGFDVVALAASAGGIGALSAVLGALPDELPVPVLIVQHLDRRHKTVIADVLSRRSTLRIKLAEDQETVVPGVVYIAPPDHHLLIDEDLTLRLTRSELVHFVRPSADLLFESVAGTYGERAIAVVLTGTGSDGAMGVEAVRSRGGTVIVEDPETAEFSGMPRAAVATRSADFVLPLADIPPVISRLLDARRGDAQ